MILSPTAAHRKDSRRLSFRSFALRVSLALRKLSTACDPAISVINNYAAGSHTLYIITSSVLQKLGHLACSTSLIASIWDGISLSTMFTPPTVWDDTNTYLLADLLINYSSHQGLSHVAP